MTYHKTNAEMLGEALVQFESLDWDVQEHIADYIDCCNGLECYYDGKDSRLCIPCKVAWLRSKWEG